MAKEKVKTVVDGTYRIPYYVSNGGDGSANVYFPQSAEAADKADENQSEGWGEPSTGTLEIVIKNGKVFYKGDKITFEEKDDDDDGYIDYDTDCNVKMEAKKVGK